MAIGWLTVLKSVPWTEVISNAPAVAEGARKLWKTVAKKSSQDQTADGTAESSGNAAQESRITALETEVSDLREQMLASSELIKTLAEQNTQLIQHIESNRRRMTWIAATTAATAIVAVAALLLANA